MKPYKILLIFSLMALGLLCGLRHLGAQSPYQNNIVYYNLGTGVTNMLASSTNTTAGFNYSIDNAFKGVCLSMQVVTYTNVGSVKIYFQTSPDNNLWETPLNSAVVLNMSLTNSPTANGAQTNAYIDWFQLSGRSRIRAARIENNSPMPISVTNVVISYPLDANIQNR